MQFKKKKKGQNRALSMILYCPGTLAENRVGRQPATMHPTSRIPKSEGPKLQPHVPLTYEEVELMWIQESV